MLEPGVVYGRTITQKELTEIRQLVGEHPQWTRRRISEELCQLWQWRAANGIYRDMAARHLLNKLEAGGWIELPARRRGPRRRTCAFQVELPIQPSPIVESLGSIQPIQLIAVKPATPQARLLRGYLQSYHYLGYSRPIGQNLRYLARDAQGRDLACLCFEAAAWKVAVRERFIGWDDQQRRQRLPWLANNTRFLILPWVQVPNLASCLLALAARLIGEQWQEKYHSPLLALETFVERDRFAGSCYRAANWLCLGQTQGRSRADRYNTLQVPVKDIYFHPLQRRWREEICRP